MEPKRFRRPAVLAVAALASALLFTGCPIGGATMDTDEFGNEYRDVVISPDPTAVLIWNCTRAVGGGRPRALCVLNFIRAACEQETLPGTHIGVCRNMTQHSYAGQMEAAIHGVLGPRDCLDFFTFWPIDPIFGGVTSEWIALGKGGNRYCR